jgi:hypothetical protein
MSLHCNHCGWAGETSDLKALGGIARLHCPECHAEYGTRDGVPIPGQQNNALDAGFFRRMKQGDEAEELTLP